MEQLPMKESLPDRAERVRLDMGSRGKYRGFAIFLICCGLLLAAFAVSSVWMQGESFLPSGDGFSSGETTNETDSTPTSGEEDPVSDPSLAPVPEGATLIVSKDLSYLSLGRDYLHNETAYRPNVEELLDFDVSAKKASTSPTVLIIHTHTGESYLPKGTEYVCEPIGDLTYSRAEAEGVLAVGETLRRVLNEKGITAIHCTVMHDDPTLSGSYARSAETVRRYLEEYPEIEYVIDLHRDAVTAADGSYVRAVTENGDLPLAQVMAVVGSDGNGTVHDGWQGNLALALQLREKLNATCPSLCRPVSLRNASFYQELAKHSLLLEIGTCANSLDEAKRAAVLVGEALAELLLGTA